MSEPVDSKKATGKIIEELDGFNGLIVLDGADGIGKSTIANLLSEYLDVSVISVDDYIIKNTDKYVNAINEDFTHAIISLGERGIIEGVCMMDVLKKISLPKYKTIYLKRMHHGIWVDEKRFSGEKGPEAMIQKEIEEIYQFEPYFAAKQNRKMKTKEEITLSALTCEIIRYHHKYQPHKNADLVYELAHA